MITRLRLTNFRSLGRRFPKERSYKPTLDQLPLTRMVDLDLLSAAGVPCFGTLQRAIQFLIAPSSATSGYPLGAPEGR
jgi:hypothetical protein